MKPMGRLNPKYSPTALAHALQEDRLQSTPSLTKSERKEEEGKISSCPHIKKPQMDSKMLPAPNHCQACCPGTHHTPLPLPDRCGAFHRTGGIPGLGGPALAAVRDGAPGSLAERPGLLQKTTLGNSSQQIHHSARPALALAWGMVLITGLH